MGSLAAASLKPLRDGATEAMLDSQLFQSVLADALDSEQVQIALRKALETEGAEHVVETLFESGLVNEFVDRLVADGAAWLLIDAVLASDEAGQLFGNGELWGLIDKALQSEGAGALVANGTLWPLIDKAITGDGASRLVDSGALWILIDRALTSDGAGRLVTSGALWKLIDQALESGGADQLVTNPALWKLITGALESGGADALVKSPALWSLIDTAIASDGAERLIHSPALWTLIDKTLESENAEGLVAKLFDSGLADEFVDRLLTSAAVWRLVDEIASSPAVTAAVTQQGLGFADQVGGELRARARRADDWLLDKARRDRNGDRTSPSGNGSARSAVGDGQGSPSVPPLIGPDNVISAAASAGANTPVPGTPLTTGDTFIPAMPATGADAVQAEPRYIGIVARTLAFTVDAALICAAALIVEFGVALIVTVAHLPSNWKSLMVVVGAIVFALWAMVYFVAFWTTTGQTPGARLMQFRVVPRKGDKLKPRWAAVRAIGLVLAAIPLFAGYLPIAIGRKRRGLQDYLARTIVVDAPQLSVADVRRSAAQAKRTRALIISGDAAGAIDGQASNERDRIALDPVRQNGEPGGAHQ
jgi:uncharacterized RDD family membrane protein YckC